MSCQLCRKTLRSNEGYKFFAFRYCDNCWELKVMREVRDDSVKTEARRLEYRTAVLKKKQRGG